LHLPDAALLLDHRQAGSLLCHFVAAKRELCLSFAELRSLPDPALSCLEELLRR